MNINLHVHMCVEEIYTYAVAYGTALVRERHHLHVNSHVCAPKLKDDRLSQHYQWLRAFWLCCFVIRILSDAVRRLLSSCFRRDYCFRVMDE
jgi:hypothetical protein